MAQGIKYRYGKMRETTMCGIIGYTGKGNAKEIMLDALELLEYRGYDSAGIIPWKAALLLKRTVK